VFAGDARIEIPAVPAAQVVDPTGCGDAYRAGLLYGLAQGCDWPLTARLASLLGSIKIASRGGQNHRFTREEIGTRFQEAFRMRLW
jgi:adenosine kinase